MAEVTRTESVCQDGATACGGGELPPSTARARSWTAGLTGIRAGTGVCSVQSVPAVVPPRPCHTLGRGFDLGKPTHLKTLGGPPGEDGTVAVPAHHTQSLHCLQQGRGGAPTWGLRRPQCVGDASEALWGRLRNRSPSVGCAERPLTTNIAGDESLFPRPEPRSLRTHRPRATTSLPHHRAACGSLALHEGNIPGGGSKPRRVARRR